MRTLLVQQYKWGGRKHYSYPVKLIEQRPDVIIVHGPYGRAIVELARTALAELITLVEERRFPFDGSAFRLREQLSRQRAAGHRFSAMRLATAIACPPAIARL